MYVSTKLMNFAAPAGRLLDLGPLMDKWSVNKDDYVSTLMTPWQLNGKQYALPKDFGDLVLFYNKKLLARAGVTPPKTWDEFLAALKALKDHGMTPLANGAKEGWTLEIAMGVLGPNFYGGSNFYEAVTRGQTTFKSPQFTGALAKIGEIRPYMPQGFMGVSYTDMQQLFINEQAAMFIGGIWELGYFQSQNPSLDIGVMARAIARAMTPMSREGFWLWK